MSKFHCDDCGNFNEACIDGYDVGEKLLEGITFKIFIDKEGEPFVNLDFWDSDPYLYKLSKEFWAEKFKDYIEDLKKDLFICSKCHELSAQFIK